MPFGVWSPYYSNGGKRLDMPNAVPYLDLQMLLRYIVVFLEIGILRILQAKSGLIL